MKGWTPEGAEVELTERQAMEVRALLIGCPDDDWATVLHTAVRYDGQRRGVPLNDPADATPARVTEATA